MNDLLVKIKRIQKALENAEREITEVLSEQPEQSSEIQDILEYLDTVLLPIISPDHWNVYSELHDMISMLPSAQPYTAEEIQNDGKRSLLIDVAPTVEPQRMRGKGRWNVYYHGEENGKSIFSYSCNQCGYGAPYNFIGGVCEQKKWNFCPNCGCQMNGDEEDEQ